MCTQWLLLCSNRSDQIRKSLLIKWLKAHIFRRSSTTKTATTSLMAFEPTKKANNI